MSSFYQPPTTGRKIVHPVTSVLYYCLLVPLYVIAVTGLTYLLLIVGL